MKGLRFLYLIAIISLLVLWCLSVSSCVEKPQCEEQENEKTFVVVEETINYKIVYDKDTMVMYMFSDGAYNRGNFTHLLNSDGTLKLYKPHAER